MSSILEIPAELMVLGLRVMFIMAIYGFLAVVIREIHRDWKRSAGSRPTAYALVVASSRSESIPTGQMFELGDQNMIGRLQSSAIHLDDEHISARHAQVTRGPNGAWLLSDAGSTNGTRLNGQPVNKQIQLKSGDVIDLGSVTLRLEPLER